MDKKEDFSRFSDRDLTRQRQSTARELWNVRDPGDPRHKELEQRYNGYAEEQWRRKGNQGEYVYKRDVRHEFHFKPNELTGEKFATMAEKPDSSGPYTLRKRDEVINWRKDTSIGRLEARKAQQDVSRHTGDDAGHLIAAEFGADPADKRNLARQDLVQNQSAAYRKEERAIRSEVDAGRQCGIEVRYRPAGARSSRTIDRFDVGADGKRVAKDPQDRAVLIGDFPNASTRAHADGPIDEAASRKARQEAHAHAAEVKQAVANQKPEDVQRWREMKEQRAAAGPPPRGPSRPNSGPPPREGPGSERPTNTPGKDRGGR